MAYELIITEKPSAALKMAEALADGKAIKKNNKSVPYYEVTHGDKDLIIVPAVGHLFGVGEKEKSFKYPSFDIEWIPTSTMDKNAAYSKKYADTIKKLAKNADSFTVACDYDIEGEVIGLNCVKFLCKQKDANRMKFSTLTKADLRSSYNNKAKTLNWGQAYAGETRHFLDWMYGINLSRALTLAVKQTGRYKTLSSGRVQGPALKLVVDKELEIRAFIPEPYWQLELNGTLNSQDISAWHHKDRFKDQETCKAILEKVKGKDGVVDKVDADEKKHLPPFPFDLTTLQTESYRCLRISPKEALALAQKLYLAGLISYPRTSSQQLPPAIGYSEILTKLQGIPNYKDLCADLLKTKLVPNNGKKTDPAHPAIYPTGSLPKELDEREQKVYDLIVRRFMATFGEVALRETTTIKIDIEKEIFVVKGTLTTKPGWYKYYGDHVKSKEEEVPPTKAGDALITKEITKHDKETTPPRRFTPSSIIKELEKRNLGTKSTRAQIVDTLYQRGYVQGTSLEATELGIQVVSTLGKHCPKIQDEDLTKHFEEEMQEIREEKKNEKEILEEAKEVLIKILKDFKKNEKEIGEEMITAYQESENKQNTVGKCLKCDDGTLMVRRGKFGRFIACDKYPDCKTTFNIPNTGFLKTTDKTCEHCSHPIIKLSRPKKIPQELCINPDCPGRQTEKPTEEEAEKEGSQCPKCEKGTLKLRKSIYGSFFGCTSYPKCKYTEKIANGNSDEKNQTE
jgi:DNA topoisomerase I